MKGDDIMAVSRKQLREEVKMEFLSSIIDFFESKEEEVIRIKSNEIAIPVVDKEGNEDFVKIVVSIPTGSNKGTEPFDAYSLAEEYQLKLKDKELKAKENAEKKQKKIEQDAKRRAKLKEMKERREQI